MDLPGATIIVAGISAAGAVLNTWMTQRTHKQVVPNSGSSLRDSVDRIENRLDAFVDYQRDKNHEFTNSLMALEGRLVARLPATPPPQG